MTESLHGRRLVQVDNIMEVAAASSPRTSPAILKTLRSWRFLGTTDLVQRGWLHQHNMHQRFQVLNLFCLLVHLEHDMVQELLPPFLFRFLVDPFADVSAGAKSSATNS